MSNQCTQPSVDFKEIFPKFLGDKEFKVTKIAPLLDAISQSEDPAIPFDPTVLEKSFRFRKPSNISLVQSGNAGWTQAII